MLLLIGLVATAAVLDHVPTGSARVGLVVCADDLTCAADGEAVIAAGADGGLPLVAFDVLLELDQGGVVDGIDQAARYAEAGQRVRDALADRRWRAAGSAADEALAALEAWPGTVPQEELFTLYFAQGAARFLEPEDEQDRAWQFSFRQAAAMVDGHPGGLPAGDPAVSRAFTDEVRKLVASGRGRLEVGPALPDGTWFVDGRPLPPRTTEIDLLSGMHRVTASRRGSTRTFMAQVPVLAERTSSVTADFVDADDAGWIRERIVDAFDTLSAPDAVTDWIARWCERQGTAEVRLVMLDVPVEHDVPPAVGLTEVPVTRPAAAEGEVIDLGDGVPSSFEDHVEALYDQARSVPPVELPGQARVVWFDARSRRFRADGGSSAVMDPEPAGSFTIGVNAGYTNVLGHHHAAVDLAARARIRGPLSLGGQVGLVRGDATYNLYPDWTDRQLYHMAINARYSYPISGLELFASLGPELFVPVSVGGVGALGVGLPFGRGWAVEAALSGRLGDGGPGWSASLAAARSY